MSSFTTSLKDTLSDLASKAASSSNTGTSTNPKNSSSPNNNPTSQPQDHQPQDAVRGLVGLIPVAQSLFVRPSTDHGSQSNSGGLLPVNLQADGPGNGPRTSSNEKKGASLGVGDEGEHEGHEEGVTPFLNADKNPMEENNPMDNQSQEKEKSGCGCSTATSTDTNTNTNTGTGTDNNSGTEECCAKTGHCSSCKGCKESKDSGKYCQCQCKKQQSNIIGEGCTCQEDSGQKQDEDGSNTQKGEYGGKTSFKDIGNAPGAGIGLGAGSGARAGDGYGSNNLVSHPYTLVVVTIS